MKTLKRPENKFTVILYCKWAIVCLTFIILHTVRLENYYVIVIQFSYNFVRIIARMVHHSIGIPVSTDSPYYIFSHPWHRCCSSCAVLCRPLFLTSFTSCCKRIPCHLTARCCTVVYRGLILFLNCSRGLGHVILLQPSFHLSTPSIPPNYIRKPQECCGFIFLKNSGRLSSKETSKFALTSLLPGILHIWYLFSMFSLKWCHFNPHIIPVRSLCGLSSASPLLYIYSTWRI